ncbi:MAG: DegT/DnrJ/EryC1/StrS family aminotransferase [bacterium]
MSEKIWLSSPHVSGREMKYIEQAFSNNHVFPLGPNVKGFEEDLKQFTGANFVTCLSSGTAALHLALITLGVKSGDEVICSSFTFSASANPVKYVNATPVFVDSELETWNMDPVLLEQAIKDRINNGKKPKAIILVHLYGMPSQVDKILDISQKYEIPLIEDAAEALGSKFKDQHLGTFGLMGILSFNGNKIITTSGGGALMSREQEYCSKSLFFATQARDDAPHYQHSHIGYNYRMSNISAGIGRGQMEVIDQRIEKRRENHFYYKEKLKQLNDIMFLEEPDCNYYSNFWLTTLLINNKEKKKEDLRKFLEKFNIESRPLWKPMHLQPIFTDAPAYTNGTSENLFDTGLCLPSSSNITDEEREFVVKKIIEFFKH